MTDGPGSAATAALVAVALALGLVVGGVVGFVAAGNQDVAPRTDMAGSAATATGCLETEPPGTGWAVMNPGADGDTLLANLSVRHGAGETVRVDFRDDGAGRYVVAVAVVEATESSGKADPAAACSSASLVELAATVPPDYESLTLTVDGDPVLAVRPNDGSFPRHWTLDTVDARD